MSGVHILLVAAAAAAAAAAADVADVVVAAGDVPLRGVRCFVEARVLVSVAALVRPGHPDSSSGDFRVGGGVLPRDPEPTANTQT